MAIKCSEESVSVYTTDSSLLVLLMEDTTKNPTVEYRIMDSRLAKLFLAVKVSFIPRERNRRADQLGRTRMLIDMPISVYRETSKKLAGIVGDAEYKITA